MTVQPSWVWLLLNQPRHLFFPPPKNPKFPKNVEQISEKVIKTHQKWIESLKIFQKMSVKTHCETGSKMTWKSAPKNWAFLRNFMQICRYQISLKSPKNGMLWVFFGVTVPFFAENSEILLRNMYLEIKNFGHLKLAKFRRFQRKMVPFHHWSSKTTQFWVFVLLFPCTKNKSFSEISENKWCIY